MCKFVAQQVARVVVIGVTSRCNLQRNNVGKQVVGICRTVLPHFNVTIFFVIIKQLTCDIP